MFLCCWQNVKFLPRHAWTNTLWQGFCHTSQYIESAQSESSNLGSNDFQLGEWEHRSIGLLSIIMPSYFKFLFLKCSFHKFHSLEIMSPLKNTNIRINMAQSYVIQLLRPLLYQEVDSKVNRDCHEIITNNETTTTTTTTSTHGMIIYYDIWHDILKYPPNYKF